MESKPNHLNYDLLTERFLSIRNVKSVHNLRIWQLTPDKVCVSSHIVIGNIIYYIQIQIMTD